MAESKPECQMRRRRSSGPKLPLNLDVGYVNEGGPCEGTPSPSVVKFTTSAKEGTSSSALLEFRKKQQSFDLDIQIEECEEEEIIIESDEEEEEQETPKGDRPITPMPVTDFGANVVYQESPKQMDFLKVGSVQNDCVTDVSEAESDEE